MVQYGRAVHAQSIARTQLKFNANASADFCGPAFLLAVSAHLILGYAHGKQPG
jgi:hypothetical protein